eukprot:8219071-Lingulodinium_polyedra.AAC.1
MSQDETLAFFSGVACLSSAARRNPAPEHHDLEQGHAGANERRCPATAQVARGPAQRSEIQRPTGVLKAALEGVVGTAHK